MVHMLIGIQGSGKSTYALELSKKLNCEIVSTDRVRIDNPDLPETAIWPEVYKRCSDALKGNRDVIYDATNITPRVRKRFVDNVTSLGAKVKMGAYFFDTPVDLCAARVEKRNKEATQPELPIPVVYSYAASIIYPTLDEGFEFIKRIVNGIEVTGNMKFKPIEHDKFDNCYKKFKDDWALLSAGKLENHNAMTVAWGGLGYLWKKEVAYIFVRPSRHTFNFTENNEYFALSFFDEKYRDALTYYGTKSGRDVNKDEECNFHPVEINNVTVYEEAKYTIICKKIYADDIKPELFLDESIDKCYPDHSYHKMYICEVVSILENE